MSSSKVYLAVDLGSGSGRVLAGEFDGHRIELHELHRFENSPVHLPDGRHWNTTSLYQEIIEGLKTAADTYSTGIVSLGIDTWGVDYGLLDGDGRLLGLPYQYRDARTDGILEDFSKALPLEALHEATGIQVMSLNTVFQLFAESRNRTNLLESAEDLLFTPDLLGYWLTGNKVQERSIVSTSQLYDPKKADWNFELIDRLGFPRKLFKTITDPGTELGLLRSNVAEKTGLHGVKVISVTGHDTASAVAAVPSKCKTPAYLSSGTWSLLGLELNAPVINSDTFKFNFTNEVGYGGKIRFLRNICGLWLIQECRRHWLAEGQDVPYGKMATLAAEAEPFRSLINPDDPCFTGGGHMVETIQDFCQKSGQPVPGTKGEVIRCIYESLALRYAEVWENLLAYTDTPPETLHIVGGGCQDKLLNQFAANAIGTMVTACPVEATGLGNIVVQMLADGVIRDLAEGRDIISNSSLIETYEPEHTEHWNAQKERFAAIST